MLIVSGIALVANGTPENRNVLGLSEAWETIPLNLAEAISPYKSCSMHFVLQFEVFWGLRDQNDPLAS